MDQSKPKGLAQVVLKRFEAYQANRVKAEEKWQRNVDAMHAATTGYWKSQEAEGWRSKTFINVTRQKVIGLYSILLDVSMPGGKLQFSLSPDQSQEQLLVSPALKAQVEEAGARMKSVLDSQLDRTMAAREKMRVIMSLGVYGEAWTKQVVEDVEATESVEIAPEGLEGMLGELPLESRRFEQVKRRDAVPTFKFRPVQAIYWDVEARDVRDSDMIIDQSFKSPHQLRAMRGLPGVIPEALERAIKQAPEPGVGYAREAGVNMPEPRLEHLPHRFRTIRDLEAWGRFDAREVRQWAESSRAVIDLPPAAEDGEDEGELDALVEVAGDEVVRFLPIRPEDRPFRRVLCEEDIDSPFGRGVADNAEPCQKVINGIVRLAEDNARLVGNFGGVGKTEMVKGLFEGFTPGRVYQATEDCDDVRQAFQQFQFTDVNDALYKLLPLFLQFLDDDTLVPKISQGLPDPSQKANTATEITTRAEQSGKYAGMIIKNLDELDEGNLEWMLDYDRRDPRYAALAGPFRIKALGFSSFMNRVERVRKLQQALALVMSSPELAARYKLDEMCDEILRALDTDVKQFKKSDEDLAAEAQQQAMMQAPAIDPAQQEMVQRQAEIEQQGAQVKMQGDAELAAAQAEEHRARAQGHLMHAEARADRERMQGLAAMRRGEMAGAQSGGAS